MQVRAVVAVLLFVLAVYAQQQATLYPYIGDGFMSVELDDISFTSEINYMTFEPNMTFYIYGHGTFRTVYPGDNFHVGASPSPYWSLPFIDFHTFQNGTDIWGVGPINPLSVRNRENTSSYQFEVAVFTTKNITNNRAFLETPVGFEGSFYTARVVDLGFDNTHVYFCGFFPSYGSSDYTQLNFGVRRAHLNSSAFNSNPIDTNTVWWFNSTVDDVVLNSNAEVITYHPHFKPMLLHARNVDPNAVNTTYLVVVDPYWNYAYLITGNYDQSVPLTYTGQTYVPTNNGQRTGSIVSAVVSGGTLFVGVAVVGTGTGWIDVVSLASMTLIQQVPLPTNYSDPRALVMDWDGQTIYIGMNGGYSVLRFNISTMSITGYQALPYYLHRVWRGVASHEHLYFITNEQHSKVFRMAKADFCTKPCMANGYCLNGKCVCGSNLVMKGNECQWKEVVHERNIASKDHGGEVALGILFALTTVAAAVGWYFVWRNRRGYAPV